MLFPRLPLPSRPLSAALSLLTGAALCVVLLPAVPATAEPESAEVEITELDLEVVEPVQRQRSSGDEQEEGGEREAGRSERRTADDQRTGDAEAEDQGTEAGDTEDGDAQDGDAQDGDAQDGDAQDGDAEEDVAGERTGEEDDSEEPTARKRSEPAPREVTDEQVVAELTDESTPSFSTLGITWEPGRDGDEPEAEFRTRSDGSWSSWQSAPLLANAAGQDRAGTDPVYVGESDGVQVRLTGAEVDDPQVSLIDPGTFSAPTVLARRAAPENARAAGSAVPRPAYVSRAGWGANESWRCGSNRVSPTIQAAIVHHTAGSNSYTRAQSAGVVRGIYAYHTRTLGWCDIGYNFLIDKYGQVYEGRHGGVDKPVTGAHATSWNPSTVGISFMGNYETAAAPAAMLEAGAQVLAWKLSLHGRDPHGKVTLAGKYINRISGHGDVMSTACPGRYVRSKMGWLRDRVETLMEAPAEDETATPAPTTAIGKRWQAMGGAEGVLGWPVAAEQKIAGGSWREFRAHDMFASSRTGAHWTAGSIRSRYRALGTSGSKLGFPTGDERAWPTSATRSNTFEHGAIVWSKPRGSHEIRGGFWDSYRTDSRLRQLLGAPRAAEHQHRQLGVPVQDFETGRTFWTGRTTTVSGGFATHYRRLSATEQAGRGVPLGPEQTSRTKKVPTQQLSKATFFWVDGRTREVYGKINDAYRAMGAEASVLGLPLGTEKAGPNGSRMSEFEGGAIVWTKAHGARVVRGGFWGSYRTDSRLRDLLGAPTRDEQPHRRLGLPVQDFQKGRAFWTGRTTTISGGFATHYRGLGEDAQFGRGVPTGPEQTSRTKRVPTQRLTKATFYWVDGRTREVYGKINDRYRALGAEASRLGLPLSTEKAGPNGSRVSAFEGGSITWTQGRAVVRYY